MGGATRSGCSKLNIADNETLKTYFTSAETEDGKDICTHCNAYKVLSKNKTKRVQHIAVCKAFNDKCDSEDSIAESLKRFKDRVILACDGYQGKSAGLEAKSKHWKPHLLSKCFATVGIILIAEFLFIRCFYSSHR
jgi:hypothetical protein